MKRQNLANKLWAWLAVLCLALFYLVGSVPAAGLSGVAPAAAYPALAQPTYNFNREILDDLGIIDYNQYLSQLSQTRDLPEVVIAVLDSGINMEHPVFKDRILTTYARNFYLDTSTKTVMDNDLWDVDQSGHGSHVAGIIADATLANVKILPIKIFQLADRSETITGDVIQQAINYVVALKKEKNLNIVAMNMSLGTNIIKTSDSNYYYNLRFYQGFINTLLAAEILPVVAAGNEGETQLGYYFNNPQAEWYSLPAACPGVMAVSAYNPYDRNQLAKFSNFGTHIRLSAPGVGIVSANRIGGEEQEMDGTSMATPFVTLCYALLMSDLSKTRASELGVEWRDTVDRQYPYYYLNVQHKALLLHAVDLGVAGLDILYGYGGVSVADFACEPSSVPFVPSYQADAVLNPSTVKVRSTQENHFFDNIQNVFWTMAVIIAIIIIINTIRLRLANRPLAKEHPTDE